MNIAFLFILYSAQFNLPDGLLSSLCYVESGHNIEAVHLADGNGNSIGACQIKLKTARFMGFRGTEKQLMRPDVNIYYAAWYLRYQINRYRSVRKGVIAYNIGNAKGLTTSEYQIKVFKQWRTNEYATYRR